MSLLFDGESPPKTGVGLMAGMGDMPTGEGWLTEASGLVPAVVEGDTAAGVGGMMGGGITNLAAGVGDTPTSDGWATMARPGLGRVAAVGGAATGVWAAAAPANDTSARVRSELFME
jgi:hypothetical protein